MNDRLRELPVDEKYLFIGIRADDTEQNAAIHNGFRMLARIECRNDYTMTLGKLLEYYEGDAKTEMLWAAVQELKEKVDELSLKQTKRDKGDDQDERF
jgi:hypothetical protein